MTNLTDIWTTAEPCPYNCSGNLTSSNLATQCHTMQLSFASMNSSLQISTVAVIILNIVASIFAVVINLLIMTALATKQQMRTAANLILTSMAFSDFLVGLLVQPFTLSILIVDVTGGSSCTLRSISNFVGSLCVGALFAITAMFAFDRCFAVSMPFEYSLSQLYKKYSIAVVAIWVVLTVLVILTNIGLMTYRVFETLMILLLLAAFITVMICYVKVYIAIINQRNKVTGVELGTINFRLLAHGRTTQRALWHLSRLSAAIQRDKVGNPRLRCQLKLRMQGESWEILLSTCNFKQLQKFLDSKKVGLDLL